MHHRMTKILPIDTSGFLRTMVGTSGTSSPIVVTPNNKMGPPPSIVSTGSHSNGYFFKSGTDSVDEERSDNNDGDQIERAPANTTPPRPSPPPSSASASSMRAETWVRTILESDPAFLTPQTLLLALQNHAPAHVIQFIMAMNPKVVTIPKTGPTPLQVAVQHDASLEVVQLLLEACPFGLCVTNADAAEDPLSYAKRYHNDRPGLIELLSRPLSYWVMQSKTVAAAAAAGLSSPSSSSTTLMTSGLGPNASLTSFSKHVAPVLMSPHKPRRMTTRSLADHLSPISDVSTAMKATASTSTSTTMAGNNTETKLAAAMIVHEEVLNVKALCSQLWKANKKMSKVMVAWKNDVTNLQKQQDELAEQLKQVEQGCLVEKQRRNNDEDGSCILKQKEVILQELKKQQHHHFYRQLVALDMKEKAFKAEIRRMEGMCLQAMDDKMRCWNQNLLQWKETTKEQLKELQLVMEHEVMVNAHFRNDLAEWMEVQHEQENRNVPSFIFATNLGELDEEAPLCGNAIKDTLLWCNGEKDTLDRVKKRPWRPLFKHRDRIPLMDHVDEASPITNG